MDKEDHQRTAIRKADRCVRVARFLLDLPINHERVEALATEFMHIPEESLRVMEETINKVRQHPGRAMTTWNAGLSALGELSLTKR